MSTKTALYFSYLLVLLLSDAVKNIDSEVSSGASIKVWPEDISVSLGDRVEVNCSVYNISMPFMLRWDKYLNNIWRLNVNTPYVKTYTPSDNTLMLVVRNALPQDEARYRCVVTTATGETMKKEMKISVSMGEMKLPYILCSHFKMFNCKTNNRYKIFCRYLCDGVENCPDGSDEEFCPGAPGQLCTNKFRCNNSQCLDKIEVCDHVDNCGDNSDEENCDYLRGPTIPPGLMEVPEDDQLSWLKTTVYTVIACTVGVVLFISVVVIAVFRIKMKRAAARRAARRAERRNRGVFGSGSHGNRTNRNQGHETEPFISSPSPTHFGNIIVNVNNGVQYVPNVVLQAPPSYSEVLAENVESPGRHSPPPAYTTIDRNPYRFSGAGDSVDNERTVLSLEESRLECQIVDETDNLSNNAHTDTALNNQSTESPDNQEVSERDCVDTAQQNLLEELEVAEAASGHIETSDTSVHSQEDRQASHRTDNVTSRPKQLHVCHGEILLDSSSSGSSSPETVNRNTQTNPADYSPGHPNIGKAAQIQVHDGQIVLASETQGNIVSGAASDSGATCTGTVTGQLEVVEGQIMFK